MWRILKLLLFLLFVNLRKKYSLFRSHPNVSECSSSKYFLDNKAHLSVGGGLVPLASPPSPPPSLVPPLSYGEMWGNGQWWGEGKREGWHSKCSCRDFPYPIRICVIFNCCWLQLLNFSLHGYLSYVAEGYMEAVLLNL